MPPLKKSELVSSVARKAHLAKIDAEAAIDALLETITEAMKEGQSISFSGFGSFSTAIRPARSVRNPRTGEAIELEETKVVKFKIGKNLKEEHSGAK